MTIALVTEYPSNENAQNITGKGHSALIMNAKVCIDRCKDANQPCMYSEYCILILFLAEQDN